MKYITSIALMFSLMSSEAMALSCLKPNIGRTFNTVNEAEETYYMVQGILTAKGPIPKRQPGVARHIPAEFTGVFFSNTGQTEERTVPVIVDAICYASWCGGFPKSKLPMLAFLKQTPEGYRVESNPCDGHFKIEITPKETKILQRCLKKGKCSNADIGTLDKL